MYQRFQGIYFDKTTHREKTVATKFVIDYVFFRKYHDMK